MESTIFRHQLGFCTAKLWDWAGTLEIANNFIIYKIKFENPGPRTILTNTTQPSTTHIGLPTPDDLHIFAFQINCKSHSPLVLESKALVYFSNSSDFQGRLPPSRPSERKFRCSGWSFQHRDKQWRQHMCSQRRLPSFLSDLNKHPSFGVLLSTRSAFSPTAQILSSQL